MSTVHTVSELYHAHGLSPQCGMRLKSVCYRHQFSKVYMLCGSADLVL